MHDEMPGSFPGGPGGEHDEPLLDMILERRPIPPRGAGDSWPGADARCRSRVGRAWEAGRRGRCAGGVHPAGFPGRRLARCPAVSPALAARAFSSRQTPLAAAATVVAAGLGSTVAAYAGVLPSPMQHFAHVMIGAPDRLRDLSRDVPAGVSSPARAHHQPATSGPPKAHAPASPVPARSKASRGWRYGLPGYSPGPSLASCLPTPSPTGNPARLNPAPSGRAPRRARAVQPHPDSRYRLDPDLPAGPRHRRRRACLGVPFPPAAPRPGR